MCSRALARSRLSLDDRHSEKIRGRVRSPVVNQPKARPAQPPCVVLVYKYLDSSSLIESSLCSFSLIAVCPVVSSIMQKASLTRLTRAATRAKTFRLPLCSQLQRRHYSVSGDVVPTSKLTDLNPSKLSTTNTTTPKELMPAEELVFGRSFTGSFAIGW